MHELPNFAAHALCSPVVTALREAARVEQLAKEIPELA